MCRFTFYTGEPIKLDALIDKPEYSLIRQSYESEERAESISPARTCRPTTRW